MSVHIENSTRFGIKRSGLIWNEDFQASRDQKGKWTGSESFTCHLKDVTKLVPANGASCQMEGFEFLKVTDIKIQNIEGDLAQVTCGFSGYSETDYPFDNENNLRNYTYDLQIVSNQEPIATFHKFRVGDPIPDADWLIYRNYLDGILTINRIPDPWDYTFIHTTDVGNDSPTVAATITSDGGKKLFDYIYKNIEFYEVARQYWRVTYTDNERPSASLLNDVGKIKNAPGAPALAGNRSWKFNGISVQENDKIFTITEEYVLSDLGGWDEFLYGDATL